MGQEHSLRLVNVSLTSMARNDAFSFRAQAASR
jgi:hypothetical protein